MSQQSERTTGSSSQNSNKSTPFPSGGRTRDGYDWVGPDVLPELYTPAERTKRDRTLRQAENLASWQVERRLSKFALQSWDGTMYRKVSKWDNTLGANRLEDIVVPQEPMTLQELNEYAAVLSDATVRHINARVDSTRTKW